MSEMPDPDPFQQLIIKEEDLKIAANIYREMLIIEADDSGGSDGERVINYLAYRLARFKLDVRMETVADCATKELVIKRTLRDYTEFEYRPKV